MSTTTQISVRVDTEDCIALDAIGEHTDRDRTYLVKTAIKDFVRTQQSQIAFIKKRVAEAKTARDCIEHDIVIAEGKAIIQRYAK